MLYTLNIYSAAYKLDSSVELKGRIFSPIVSLNIMCSFEAFAYKSRSFWLWLPECAALLPFLQETRLSRSQMPTVSVAMSERMTILIPVLSCEVIQVI